MLQLHEAISGHAGAAAGSADTAAFTAELKPEADPLASIRRAEFQDALDAFCDLLRPLPEPVLLILDTCEELAKLSPSGAMLPSLMAAFEILEYVHKKVASVRVIFANGRRLLALSGETQPDGSAGWYVDEAATAAKGHLPKCKGYLRIHQLRGFDRQDPETLLHSKSGRKLDGAMMKAVSARSREPSTAIPILRVTPEAPGSCGRTLQSVRSSTLRRLVGRKPAPGRRGDQQRNRGSYVELRDHQTHQTSNRT